MRSLKTHLAGATALAMLFALAPLTPTGTGLGEPAALADSGDRSGRDGGRDASGRDGANAAAAGGTLDESGRGKAGETRGMERQQADMDDDDDDDDDNDEDDHEESVRPDLLEAQRSDPARNEARSRAAQELGNLNAAQASPTARTNAAPNSMVGQIAAYEIAMREAMTFQDATRRDAAITAAREQLAQSANNPLTADVISRVDSMLGIQGASPQLGALR